MGPRTSVEKLQHIIERFVHEKRVVNKSRQAPNKIFTEKECEWLVRQVKKNPTRSAPKLAEMAEKYLSKSCHPETVRRVLKKATLNGKIARNKPLINAEKFKGKEKEKKIKIKI
ncbi:uncharacterized protein LOC128856347 [Anastrepha ludens]|uniref:uncharacterized protein LOC128856347 n=1 Tax=Anastrepha ludens TaxID=28586 RepID=UPI0023B07DD8|nr:uncharacterized protein LOC128856347 [Anastrepha ludens]